jgi:DNA repair exonuclease SbcCD nuclease subunit
LRIVHLSDLHLGYRQYQRLTPGGINQREADVASTFRTAIDRVIELSPDVVLVAGDVFHTVRPTNQAILHAFVQFSRLVQSLPNSVIVLVAGNHDSPRSTETGGILPLLAQLGMQVVDREARRLSFPDRDLSILAIPDVHGVEVPALTPDSGVRFNLLVLHGEIQGALPDGAMPGDRAAIEIPAADLHASRWDYIALGHYHVYREVAPNAYYSGSIDYTSVNTWGELYEQRIAGLEGKGFIERDLVSGRHTYHTLPSARPLIDLPAINARGMTAVEIDERILAAVDACDHRRGIEDKIVRLVIRDVPRHIARELDHRAIRDYKRRALNFQLDIRRPDVYRLQAAGGPGRRQMDLKDIVSEKLRMRPLDAGVDRDALVARAIAYIDEAQSMGVPAAPLVEI